MLLLQTTGVRLSFSLFGGGMLKFYYFKGEQHINMHSIIHSHVWSFIY